MSEFAEDLGGPRLPDTVEPYFAQERSWWRLLRGTNAVTEAEMLVELRGGWSPDHYGADWILNPQRDPLANAGSAARVTAYTPPVSLNAAQDDTDASRRRLKITLDSKIASCRRCAGMNIDQVTASAPGYGCLTSPVALVGQSLCKKCMESQIPFTGGSGELIDDGIQLAGLAKPDVFITNAAHCHPPKNRVSLEHEIVNCSPHLHRELEIVRPRLAITLGRDAERLLTFFYPRARVSLPPFQTPRGRLPRKVLLIFTAKHPSWIQRQHDDALEADYVADLAAAIRWSFERADEDTKG